MSEQLMRLKAANNIPQEMTEEQAAKFYGSHDLGDIWDELEPIEEPIELSPELQKTIHLRLTHRYLIAIRRLAEQKGMPYRALIRSWIIERAEVEAPEWVR